MSKALLTTAAYGATLAFMMAAASPALAAQDGSAPADAASQETAPQAEPAAPDGQGDNDVIVTAQRREQSLQSVAASITAMSGESLVMSGISSSRDIELVTPGLVFNSFNGFGVPYIRGAGNDNLSPNSESPVAYYVDGVYYASPYMVLDSLADVERVEVLRGPQGTLYGRNSTGGAINVVTRRPEAGLTGSLGLSYGNYDAMHATGYLSGGSDTIAASIAGMWSRRDGYLLNRFDGSLLENENRWGLRGRLRLNPADNIELSLAADYSEIDDRSGQGLVALDDRPLALLLGGNVGRSPRETYLDLGGAPFDNTKVETGGASLTARIDLGSVNLVSITAHRFVAVQTSFDSDGSDLFLLTGAGLHNWSKTYTQEFQLVSSGGGPFNWIAGAYLYSREGGLRPLQIYSGSDTPILEISGRTTSFAAAAFLQGTYDFDEHWTLTGGGRFSYERIRRTSLDFFDPPSGVTTGTPQDRESFTSFDPMASLRYTFGDSMLYATGSSGFRSGAFNETAPEPAVNPERVVSFEVGGKHRFLDRALRFNWAAFYTRYSDLQVISFEGTLARLQNAGKARAYGVEIEAQARLSQYLELTGGLAWLHATYTSFPDAAVYVPDPATGGFGFTIIQADVTGNRLPNSPDLTFNASLRYRIPVGPNNIILSATYSYNDGHYYDAANAVRQGSYNIVNARVEWQLFGNSMTVSAWVNNLFDETYLRGVAITNFATLGSYSPPRLYGLSLGWRM